VEHFLPLRESLALAVTDEARKERPDLWEAVALAQHKKQIKIYDVDKLGKPIIGSQPALSAKKISSRKELQLDKARALKGATLALPITFSGLLRNVGVRAS
jgi:hypothetical protein